MHFRAASALGLATALVVWRFSIRATINAPKIKIGLRRVIVRYYCPDGNR